MKYFLALSVACLSTTVLSAPLCIDTSSDPAGDGWGWENGDSCMMPLASTPVTVTNSGALSACLADGNLLEAENTRLRSQIAALQSGTSTSSACVDTTPVGDGWGWDGTETCHVSADTDSIDISTTVPSCARANQRILNNVEVGMSLQQVRQLVGKPRHVSMHGSNSDSGFWGWAVGIYASAVSFPRIDFDDGLVRSYHTTSGEYCN